VPRDAYILNPWSRTLLEMLIYLLHGAAPFLRSELVCVPRDAYILNPWSRTLLEMLIYLIHGAEPFLRCLYTYSMEQNPS
jgi:predicted methyltransferase